METLPGDFSNLRGRETCRHPPRQPPHNSITALQMTCNVEAGETLQRATIDIQDTVEMDPERSEVCHN